MAKPNLKDKLYSVSHISFFENELRTVFVISNKGPMVALMRGLQELLGKGDPKAVEAFEHCESVEDAKAFAFDCDSMVDVKQYRKSESIR